MPSLSEADLRVEPTTRRALVVVGMHRSGTSAMTRMLSLLGAVLPTHLMDAHADNPSGFWESDSIKDLNDEILQSLDSEWDDVFAFRPRQYLSNFDRFYLGRAGELLQQEFGNSQLIVVKDPRVSVLARFWDRALREAGYATSYIVMVRNPLEVADSLRDRNAFPREKSLLLWTSYMLALERDTREQERIFIGYDELIRDWRGARRRIEESTAVPFPRDTAAAANEIDRFLDHKLRHHESDCDALLNSPDVPEHVKTLYRIFREACSGGGIDRAALDAVHAKIADVDALVGSLVADLRANVRTLAGHRDALSKELQTERERRQSEADAATGAAEDLRRQLDEVASRVQAVEIERDHALALSRIKDSEFAELAKLKEEEIAELAKFKEDEIAELAKLKDDEIAELAKLKDDEIAELAKLKEDETADLAARLTEADSTLSALRAECTALETRLTSVDAQLKTANQEFAGDLRKIEAERDTAQASTRAAEAKQAEAFQELATITQLLRKQERHAEAAHEHLDWALAIQQQIVRQPRWWSLMPKSSRRKRELRKLKRAGLFDGAAYLQRYPDVAAAGFDPLDHYLRYGIHEGRVRDH
jgi:hypothetical protein